MNNINNELLLFKLFIKDINYFNLYKNIVEDFILDKQYKFIYNLIVDYYNKYNHHTYIEKQELISFFNLNFSLLKDKDIYLDTIELMYTLEVSDSLIKDIIKNLIEKDKSNKIINKLLPVITEGKTNILQEIKHEIENYERSLQISISEESPFIEKDLDDLINEEVFSGGLNWRLSCLQTDIGPLRGGTLGHVFARPDTGKTSFLASEITNFAEQLDESACGIWFNNEEKGTRVKLRNYTAMLGAPLNSIVNNIDKAKAIFEKRGGNKIKIFDEAFITIEIMEKLIKTFTPRFIVVDQGDKVTFKGSHHLDSTPRLKELYRKFRELAKVYNIDIITAGQASAEAEGKRWLQLDHMDNSKTGKPGELDYAIGIGKTHDESSDDFRFIALPKNKMATGKHSKTMVIFDSLSGRYKDS
jgi:replicative DNA helicase